MDPRDRVGGAWTRWLGDDGVRLRADIARGDTWKDVLADVPVAVFDGVGDARESLTRVRDHWGRDGALRSAIAATRALHRGLEVRFGASHPDVLVELGALGALAGRAGRSGEARRLLERAWQGLRTSVGGDDPRIAVVAAHVGAQALRDGELKRADGAFSQARRIRLAVAPETAGLVAARLAEVRMRMGEPDAAVDLLEEAIEYADRVLGPHDPRTSVRVRLRAQLLTRLGRVLEAEPMWRRLHAVAMVSDDPEARADTALQLGLGLQRVGLSEEGARAIELSVQQTRAIDRRHPALPERLVHWARVLQGWGRRDEAEGTLKEAIERETASSGADSPRVAVLYVELAQFLLHAARGEEAVGWLDPAVRLLEGRLGRGDPRTRRAAEVLLDALIEQVQTCLARGDRDAARAFAVHAREIGGFLPEGHRLHGRVSELGA